MKKTSLSLFLLLIIFWGCSDSADFITGPSENSSGIVNSTQPHPYSPRDEISLSQIINGETGGLMVIDTSFVEGDGDTISICAKLRILPNSFPGEVEITMIPVYDSLSIRFFPEMTFERDLRLTLTYKGVDLASRGYTQTGTADFVYFNDAGHMVNIQYNGLLVNLPQDKISVLYAKLPHFSRFGFTRDPECPTKRVLGFD